METRTEKIKDFFNELYTSIDILEYIDPETVESFEDVYNQIDDNGGFNVEIRYHNLAMEYLSKYDPSLQESMQIAEDCGYTPENLNPGVLASLHASQATREEIQSFEYEINEFFNKL